MDSASVSAPSYSRWKLCGAVLGAAVLLALIDTGPTYLGNLGARHPITFIRSVEITLIMWISLGVIALPALWLASVVRVDERKGVVRLRHYVFHALAALTFAFAHLVLSVAVLFVLGTPGHFLATLSRSTIWLFTVDFLIYWGIVGGYYAFYYYRVASERGMLAVRFRSNLTDARLDALRAQLNPHFLFNTLNAVSVLAMKEDMCAVRNILSQLSDLLRISFDDAQPQLVPLGTELEFVDRYLGIQHVRFGDRLTVDRDIDVSTLETLVPSLILQPIVENAIVHGMSFSQGAAHVCIQAARQNGTLRLTVKDAGPGFHATGASVRKGVGLTNTRERLTCLYGSGSWIEFGNSPSGGAIVTVCVPAHHPASVHEQMEIVR